LDSKRDWGYAPEYVECMWKILQHKKPDDYVVASNSNHTVREFAKEAFKVVDLDYKKFVKQNKKLFRPLDVDILKGDYSKAKKILNWKPRTSFKTLVKLMVESDITQWQRWQKGEKFAWDAPFDIEESRLLKTRHPD